MLGGGVKVFGGWILFYLKKTSTFTKKNWKKINLMKFPPQYFFTLKGVFGYFGGILGVFGVFWEYLGDIWQVFEVFQNF